MTIQTFGLSAARHLASAGCGRVRRKVPKPRLQKLLLPLGLLGLAGAAQAGSVSFSYTLPAAATTSAGAYKADGTLIRTLWNNELKPAGTNTAAWDGLDDNGQPVAATSYEIRVLTHNVTYTWEGFIGNTSTAQTGTTVHRSYQPICGMAIAGTSMFPIYGYNEKRSLWSQLSTSTPNSVSYWGPGDYSRIFSSVTTDGTNVYCANEGNVSATPYNFVAAFKASDNSLVTFANGVMAPSPGTSPSLWPSVIDLQSGTGTAPTGIAVQPSGSYLFVAHSGQDQIKVFDKTSGALVNTVTATAPTGMACTMDGDLWAICTEGGGRVLRRYDVDAAGNLTPAAVKIGLNNPLAIAVSPDNNTMVVADGGTIQQVKAYTNVTSGTLPGPIWTLGLQGGYNATNGPDVTNTKFCFFNAKEFTYLAFQPDGSFWLGDPGNERNLHFSASHAYVDQIAYPSANYVTTVCPTQPNRVFGKSWLEYNVDYSQPIASSWTLVKNWRAGLPSSLTSISQTSSGNSAVVELGGRVFSTTTSATSGYREILELPATGCARVTGIQIPSTQTLHEDGSLRYQTLTPTTATFYRRTFNSLDASFNPTWNTATVMASTPLRAEDPAGNAFTGPAGPRFPITSTNLLVTANTGNAWVKHLGGINMGDTKWQWKAAQSGVYYDLHGAVGNSQYTANVHFTSGQNILFGCHGEFYLQQGQANQFLHYWDDGLMVGEFGTIGIGNPLNSVVAGVTGNAFSPYLIQVGSNLYVWVNDEWGSGIHRWKINNPESIAEITPVSVTVPATGGTGTGLTGQYFTGTDFSTLDHVRTDQTVNFSWSGSPAPSTPADNFSVRWSGLVQPLYSQNYTFYTQSDDGVRLWVNGTKIIDNWTNHTSTENSSTPISLTAGQKYTIVMEFYEGTGGATAQLKWSSTSQAKGIIPMQQLYPSGARAINCGGTAVGRFETDPIGTTGTRIVTTANTIDLSGVTDPGPMSIYQVQRQNDTKYDFSGLTPFANYKVRVHVAEIVPSRMTPTARSFPIKVNTLGDISPNLNPYAMAGTGYKAAVQEFVATADNTGLIQFNSYSSSNSLLAGIELGLDTSDSATNPAFARVGKGTGLKGQYYSGNNFNTLVSTRTDPEVNFNWANAGPMPSVGPHNYTVRWTGKVQTIQAGDYSFSLNHTNGARLWVNGQLLIDQWTTSGNHSGTITLAASTQYDIQVDYLDDLGSSVIALNWKLPGVAVFRLVPQSQLYPAP